MDGDRDVPSGTDGDRGTPAGTDGDREAPAGVDGDRDDPGGASGGDDTLELGVQLLARLEHAELELPEVIDRIETVTEDPQTTRDILETAEARGHITRDGATVRPTGGRFLRFESDVVSREGEFDCRRCGASISTGYFMRLEAGEHGPFGSSCIRKVTGRE